MTRAMVLAVVAAMWWTPARAWAGDEPSAADVAGGFYGELVRDQIYGYPTAAERKRLEPYLSAPLVRALRRLRAEQLRYIRTHGADQKPPGDGYLFGSLLEGFTAFEIGKAETTKRTTRIQVHLTLTMFGDTERWTDVVVLRHTKRGWRVVDIEFGHEHAALTDNVSLRRNIL